MILIFCSRNKVGLLNEVEQLCFRFNSCGLEARVLFYEERYAISDGDVLILYHLNRFMFHVLLRARLVCVKIVYVEHEPTTYLEKRMNNKRAYSFVVVIVQKTLRYLSDKTVSPSLDLGLGRHTYVNLNYELKLTSKKIEAHKYLYLGRRDSTRGYDVLAKNENIEFFPNDIDLDRSDANKLRYLASSRAVVNVYNRRITQSGVTADALSKGIPVIVSETDRLLKSSTFGGYLKGVKSLNEYSSVKFNDCNAEKLKEDFERIFGMTAFKATWLKAIESL